MAILEQSQAVETKQVFFVGKIMKLRGLRFDFKVVLVARDLTVKTHEAWIVDSVNSGVRFRVLNAQRRLQQDGYFSKDSDTFDYGKSLKKGSK